MAEKYHEEIIKIPVSTDEFEAYVGRPPKDYNEFLDFVSLADKGIHAQVDFAILYSCCAENFSSEIDEEED